VTIHAVMLAGLGFLSAILIGLFIAPAYRKRTERLATDALKRAMPLTEAEIRADKDRLRADYALVIHDLESKVEKASLTAARQRVEINRRDAAISGLEGEVGRLRTSLEEHENARRVLEHTIMDRLPKVEQRLAEARRLLTQRDREIARLSASAEKQSMALEEATQINTQNRDEIHRLSAALTLRSSRNRDGLGGARFDGEVALKSEIEALRAKTRDQAALIARLQGLLARAGGSMGALGGTAVAGDARDTGRGSGALRRNGSADNGPGLARAEDEIVRLRAELTEAEAKLRSLETTAEAGEEGQAKLESDLRALKSDNQDQAREILQLKAELATYRDSEQSDAAIAESKMAMKARIASLSTQSDEQTALIQSLRADLAASNERMARQASHFMEELRRLGAGTVPTTGPAARRSGPAPAGHAAGPAKGPSKRSLSERIADPRPGPGALAARELAGSADNDRTSGFLKALGGDLGADAAVKDITREGGAAEGEAKADASASASSSKPAAKRRSGGLLDRITGVDSSSE